MAISFSSCALFTKKIPSIDPAILKPKLKSTASKICLNSDGKGRIQFLSSKHVFSYEAVNNLPDKRWSLGLNIPLHGEEVMHLFWGSEIKVQGAFYQRLLANAEDSDNRKEYEALLRNYIIQFASMIGMLEDMKSSAPRFDCVGGLEGICHETKGKFRWTGLESDKFTLTSLRDERYQLVLEAFAVQDEYFRRLKIFLVDNEKMGPMSTLMEMELSLQSCQ